MRSNRLRRCLAVIACALFVAMLAPGEPWASAGARAARADAARDLAREAARNRDIRPDPEADAARRARAAVDAVEAERRQRTVNWASSTDVFAAFRRDRLTAWREALEDRRARSPVIAGVGPFQARAIRNEILAIAPSEEALAGAARLRFEVARERLVEGLGLRLVVLRAPAELEPEAALAALQAADPAGAYEFNHLYSPTGGAGAAARALGVSAPSAAAAPPRAATPAAGVKIGVIDTGLDQTHPALAGARVVARAFVEQAEAAPHGTAVASLLVGEDKRFTGALPGAELYAADVFGASDAAGSAEAIVAAIGWIAQSGARVINLSLVGPPNRVLEAGVRAFQARGGTIVAAVGNDGPTAPVGYPAAYPGVVAVTAVDRGEKVFVAANRGPEVAFAAPGVRILAAEEGAGYAAVSGTSFAAPYVAAEIARELARAPSTEAAAVIQGLAGRVRDLGPPGRDPIYGYGAI